MFMVKICASVKTKIRMDSIFYNAIVVLFCIFFLAVHSIFLNYRYVISLFIHVLTVVENTDFVLQMVNMLQCDKTNDTLSFLSDFNSRHVPCDHSISRYC